MRSSFLLVLLLSLASLTQAQDRLTPENLWELKRLYGEQVSPDGKQILYSLSTYDLNADKGTAHLYIIDLQGSTHTRVSDGSESIYDAKWRPDGMKIGYLSTKSGSMQLWEMNPDGSGRTQITSEEGGISNWSYAPNMMHISFTKEVKVEESLADKHDDLPKATGKAYDNLMFRHWTQWHDYHYSHVFIASYVPGTPTSGGIDLMEGEPYDSPLAPFGGGESIAWSPDGSKLVYVSKKKVGKDWATSTNSDLYMYDLETRETSNLSSFNLGYDNEPVFSPDGTKLAWLSMARDGFESDKNVIRIMDLKSNKHYSLTGDIDQSFGHPVWSTKADRIWALSAVDATYQIFALGVDKSGQRSSFKQLTKGVHNINSIQLAGEALIGTKSSMSAPNELYAWNVKSGEASKLSKVNADLMAGMQMGKVEKRMVETTDGKEMLTWVIYPPNFDPEKKYPTLLYCQGGPQSAVSQFFSYRWNFQLMAANGYIVVAPNRRGLPSFGQEWNDQISKDWGGQAMKDYLSAIDALAQEPYVDEERLGAVGASYGGYSVYYLAGIHEGRFKTFISHCGLYNLESWYASTEELFFANWDIGGPYWESPQPKSYALFSPHKLVGNWDTPIMVIHNELDFRVPLNQGLEAFTAAQLQGIPSKLLYYPDEGHWVLKPQNGVMWHREFYDWLDEWLKP
jgi:dipeptidyl aminopeptidase/acylaminoacyl peptidase